MAVSLQTLERRILALEARLADFEGGYGESIRNRLEMGRLLDHFTIPHVSEEEIDNTLDNEA